MIDDMIIVDGVVHAYNWTQENYAHPAAQSLVDGTYGLHYQVSPPDFRLDRDEWIDDWQVGPVEAAVFGESPIDMGCYHATPAWDMHKDGQNKYEKGVELKQRNPDRIVLYGNANPYADGAMERVERMVEDGISGVKTFPASFESGHSEYLALDSEDVAFPFIEHCLDLGIHVISSHKSLPLGPNKFKFYGVEDVEGPAAQYPEMNFEIVHSGMAFAEETAILLSRFPNVWANLEVTNSLLIGHQERFAEILGQMLWWGAEDRIIFGSGIPLVHPKPIIDAMLAFEMPEHLREGKGYPEVTMDIKRKILGENFLRLHNINPDELRDKIAGDAWSEKQRKGLDAPWHTARNGVDRHEPRPHR